MTDTKTIAERIADDLFTNGMNQKASRLVLMYGYGTVGRHGPKQYEKDIGGWCRESVVARVQAILDLERKST